MPSEAAAVVTSIRQVVQDLLAPDIREMRADIRAVRERLEAIDRRFDRLEESLSTYRDVQLLKKQMAEMRAAQKGQAHA